MAVTEEELQTKYVVPTRPYPPQEQMTAADLAAYRQQAEEVLQVSAAGDTARTRQRKCGR
jgi:hypothetical protein